MPDRYSAFSFLTTSFMNTIACDSAQECLKISLSQQHQQHHHIVVNSHRSFCFFLTVGKNQLLTVKKVRHSSIAYQTFCAQMKPITQVCILCKYIVFFAKKNKEKVCATSSFGLVSVNDLFDAKSMRHLWHKTINESVVLISA